MDPETLDYSPLRSNILPIKETREHLHAKKFPMPDSAFYDGHASFELGDSDVETASRLYNFTNANGFELIGNLPGAFPFPESFFRSVAGIGLPMILTYGFVAQLEAGWLEIGELRVENQSRYQNSDLHFTYVKVTLGIILPEITIDSRSAGLSTDEFSKPLYKTESNEFDKVFKLYLDRSVAPEGLKILSPDVMSILIDYFNQFDIEMRDHTVSLLTERCDLTDPIVLKNLIETALVLADELTYQVRTPISANAIPNDIESYKKLYGYIHFPDEILWKRARHETLRVFLYATIGVFSVVLILIIIMIVSTPR